MTEAQTKHAGAWMAQIPPAILIFAIGAGGAWIKTTADNITRDARECGL